MNTAIRALMVLAACMLCAATALAGGAAESGGAAAEVTAATEATVPGKEAPLLAEMVKRGLIPPLEERLPEEPMVVKPLHEPGRYGGTVLMPSTRTDRAMDAHWVFLNFAGGIMPDAENFAPTTPDLSKSFELSPDGRIFTLTLRKGLKWSDGEPFTTDDILYRYEHELLNEELTPRPGRHPHAPRRADRAAAGGRADGAVDLSATEPGDPRTDGHPRRSGPRVGESRPTSSRSCTRSSSATRRPTGTRVTPGSTTGTTTTGIGIRAPIRTRPCPVRGRSSTRTCWSTGARAAGSTSATRTTGGWTSRAGSWPYIDRVIGELVENNEIVAGKVISGELDMSVMYNDLLKMPLYMEHRGRGNYQVLEWQAGSQNVVILQPNHSIEKPQLRALFNEKRFKHALSLAIDRQAISEQVFFGFGEPLQFTVNDNTPLVQARIRKRLRGLRCRTGAAATAGDRPAEERRGLLGRPRRSRDQLDHRVRGQGASGHRDSRDRGGRIGATSACKSRSSRSTRACAESACAQT